MKKDFKYFLNKASLLMDRDWKMLINGEMVNGFSKKELTTYNPSNGEKLAKFPYALQEDVDQAVIHAMKAQNKWGGITITERVKYIDQMLDIIKENREDLALIDSINSGNPLKAMLKDVDIACEGISFLAGAALNVKGDTFPSTNENLHLTIREPYGVVGRIIPYNHPFMFTATKIIAPVLMGNALIIKVPDQDPLAPLYFAELIKDVFPPGIINIISGDGEITGNSLVKHPYVERISLIGSVETGLKIQEAAAKIAVKDITLELGGKNPMIVFSDADIDKAVEGAFNGMNLSSVQGQSCGSISRLFLHEKIHDVFVQKLLIKIKKAIKIGNPIDPDTNMGCLISKNQFDKVKSHIKKAIEEGGELVYGGDHPNIKELKNGFYIEPTVFTNIKNNMSLAQKEIFGPVLSILKWEDEKELLENVNSTEYGLTGAVWTNDIKKAVQFSKAIESGVIWVNQTARHYLGMPFTGYKNSGLGSEESIEELYSFTRLKTINIILN